MDTAILENLGLTKYQVRIYLTLLEIGYATVGTLVTKIDIDRVCCYDSLNRLRKKGLVGCIIKDKKKYFQAVEPEKLLKILEEKEEVIKKEKEELKKALPELMKKMKRGLKENETAIVYKSKEGIKSMFELMLKEKEILIISATGKALKELKYYFIGWQKKRIKNKIRMKIVFNAELIDDEIIKMDLAKIKFAPKQYSSPSTCFIFGNIVVNLLWGESPTAFLIKSNLVAQSYRNYFNLLWRSIA